MQIFINEQELDFTLEHEVYFIDIYQSLLNWLLQSGMNVLNVSINNLVQDDKAMQESLLLPVDKIKTIHVQAEKSDNDLSVIIEYFQLLIEALASNNEPHIKELLEEYSYIKNALPRFFNHSDEEQALSALVSKLLESRNDDVQLLKIVTLISIKLQSYYREQHLPHAELFSTVLMLENQLDQYCNIAVYLQTGKEKEAYQLILEFNEYAQKIIRIVKLIKAKYVESLFSDTIDNVSTEEFFQKFSSVLEELVQAFENEDIILIGDLMEYEIVPILEKLIQEIKSRNN